MAGARPPLLRITKWDEYQHYPPGSRQMIWAKLYSKRLSDYDLMGLRAASRELSTCLICVAIETANEIPNDVQWLAKRAHLNTSQIDCGIKDLLAIGFVERIVRKRRASNALADCYPLTETEKKRKESSTTDGSKGTTREPVDLKNHDKAFHVERLLGVITDGDEGTPHQIRQLASQLPAAVSERIREQIQDGNVLSPARYAHSELIREVSSRGAA